MRRALIVFLGLALTLSMAGCSKNSSANVTPTPAGTGTPGITTTPDGGDHSPAPGATVNPTTNPGVSGSAGVAGSSHSGVNRTPNDAGRIGDAARDAADGVGDVARGIMDGVGDAARDIGNGVRDAVR